MTFHEHDATGLADLVRTRQVSSAELTAAAIAKAERENPSLNAIIHPRYERALTDAAAAREGPLAGVPIVVKDASVTEAGESFHAGLQAAKDVDFRATTTSWL